MMGPGFLYQGSFEGAFEGLGCSCCVCAGLQVVCMSLIGLYPGFRFI